MHRFWTKTDLVSWQKWWTEFFWANNALVDAVDAEGKCHFYLIYANISFFQNLRKTSGAKRLGNHENHHQYLLIFPCLPVATLAKPVTVTVRKRNVHTEHAPSPTATEWRLCIHRRDSGVFPTGNRAEGMLIFDLSALSKACAEVEKCVQLSGLSRRNVTTVTTGAMLRWAEPRLISSSRWAEAPLPNLEH